MPSSLRKGQLQTYFSHYLLNIKFLCQFFCLQRLSPSLNKFLKRPKRVVMEKKIPSLLFNPFYTIDKII